MAAFAHRPTDRVPVYHAGFSSRAASAVLGREAYVGGGIQQYRESVALWHGPDAHAEFLERSRRDALDLTVATEQDLVRPTYWRLTEKPTRRIDERTFFYGDPNGRWAVRRFDPDIELYGIVEQSPQAEVTLDDLPRLVEAAEREAAGYTPAREHLDAEVRAVEDLAGEYAVPVRGPTVGLPIAEPAWLEAVLLRPDLIARYLTARADRSIRLVEHAAAQGFRLFMGGADFAGNQGPFYSPKAFRELVLPPLQRLTAAIHRHGGSYMVASDGDLWPVAEDLFGRSGVDGYFEIDRLCNMDLGRLRQAYPDLTLLGNISSQTLHTGTRQQVIDETRSCIEEAKRSGSILVGTSNQVVCETPLENMFAMLETIARER
jgi:hypothetical protein